ncbi:MAG: hypothetical protein ACJ77A_10480 [Actinomycetota bacterium]
MSTTTESPPRSPADGAGAVRQKRRWGRRALVAAPVVLLVAVLATLAWASTYDPLCHRPCGGVAAVRGDGVTDVGLFTSPEGDEFSAVRVAFRPGGEFGYWFSLLDDGSFGITITAIGAPANRFDQLPIAGVQIQPPESGGTAKSTLRPFHPFSLAPRSRQAVDVFVTVRMRGCLDAHTVLGFGSIQVTYRFLGITQHTSVFLPESFEVTGPPGATCSH